MGSFRATVIVLEVRNDTTLPHLRSVTLLASELRTLFDVHCCHFYFISKSNSCTQHNIFLWECEEIARKTIHLAAAWRGKWKIYNHTKNKSMNVKKEFFDFRFNVNSVSRSFKTFISPRTLILRSFTSLMFASCLVSLRSLDFDFEAEQQHSLAHSLSSTSTLPSCFQYILLTYIYFGEWNRNWFDVSESQPYKTSKHIPATSIARPDDDCYSIVCFSWRWTHNSLSSFFGHTIHLSLLKELPSSFAHCFRDVARAHSRPPPFLRPPRASRSSWQHTSLSLCDSNMTFPFKRQRNMWNFKTIDERISLAANNINFFLA